MNFVEAPIEDDDNIPDDWFPKMPEPLKKVINENHPQIGDWAYGYDTYMSWWPENMSKPASIVVISNQWVMDVMDTYYYTEYLGWDPSPEMKLTMPNGATFELRYLDPIESGLDEYIFNGPWDVYFAENGKDPEEIKETIIEIVDTAYQLQYEEEETDTNESK